MPLGWSVLLGVDIELPSPVAILRPGSGQASGNGGGPAWGFVRVPLAALGAADPQTITAAIWDDTAQQWCAGPPATLIGDALEIPVPSHESPVMNHQLALLVADASPAAPPPPVVGEPIQGVGPVHGSADSGSVTADPLVILAGTNGSAFMLTRAHSATPLPSGTLLRVDLHEHYTLRDGSEVTGTVATEEVVGYQLSPSTSTNTSTSLAAYFRLVPSRNYGLGELRSGQVDIALSLAEAAGNVALIDSNGGTVNGPSGLRLVVPPHAATAGSLLTLVPVAPASLPAGAGTRADFVGAFALQVSGGGLDPLAAYRLGLGATVADGQQFVIGRLGGSDQGSELVFVALGHSDNGEIVLDGCNPNSPRPLGEDQGEGCLAGLDGSGTYAVFALPAAVAIVTGTVADSTGPRAGIPVGSDQLPVVSVTDANGCYMLPAPVGVTSKLTARDTANDLSGSASVLPSPDSQLPSPPLTADIELHPSPPQVVQINPPNHASQVERSAVVTVTFSKAIDPASVSEASALLLQTDSRATSTSHEIAVRRSLSADGTQLVMTPTNLLAPNTVYQLTLTSAVTDRHGNPLSPNTVTPQHPNTVFACDFTTSPIFKADALPPNTLRVSLPDDGAGNVPPIGTVGRVFVCGGANLAAPGTAVVVQNTTSQVTYTASATDANGVSGSDPSTGSGQGLCDVLFPGRCDTAAPGAFCAVVDAAIGDKIQVQVQDVLHNTVTLDAGNMTDERTGATAIGPDGGRVAAVEDARYRAEVPPGAFDTVHTVTVFPVRNDEFPVQLSENAGLQRLGAVFLDFGDDAIVAAREIHLTIPAPPDFDPQRQVLVGHVIQFRGWPELTMVDTASYSSDANGQGTLTTNSPPFPGVTRAGHYDFCTPDRAVGYAVGMVDKQQSTIAVMPTFITFVFPFVDPVLSKFVMPVPANQPFTVSLTDVSDRLLDAIDIQGPPPGQIVDIGTLSDDPTPPAIDGFDIAFNQRDVPGDVRPVLTFNRPVRSNDGRLPVGSIEVRGPNGLIDGVWVVVSPDGRRVRFFPTQPLPPGVTITVHVVDVRDFRGRTFPGFSTTFTTYDPVLVATLPLPANDVDVLRRVVDGVPQLYAVVARDGDETSDDQHGLTVVDVRNPRAPRVVADVATPGVDRAVRVVTSDPPLVLSVDGAGNPQRFGTLRAFDLSEPAHPVEIGRRVLNLSPQVIREQIYFLDGVPNEGGVPRSLALLGTGTVYVANPPVLGVQGVTIGGMIPPHNAVEGSFPGGYRAVATIGPYVLAAGQGHGQSELAVLSADLTRVIDRQPLGSAPLEIITAPGYPIDLDGDGNLGAAEDTDGDATTDADERLDLVLVPAGGPAISVFALGAGGSLTPNGSMMLPSEIGGVRGGTVDPQHRRLYLAGGTAGLVIVNFDDPLRLHDPGSVLKTLRLSGQARQVRLVTDARGVQYALVASDRALDIVQLAPAEAGLTIYDTNNSSVVEEQYEESEGTFILANNDNDNANADSQGRPIIDRDDPGRVEGENDLRRLDIVAPMRDGVLTLDMPTGAEQARVWLSNEREGLLALPWQYDLGRGEHPPQTVWIEGVAPSAADRDVRITYHWEPPPDSGLDPIDDAVTATVVELDFIPGQHGTNEPATNWLDDRKTTFLQTDAEDVEALMNGDLQASHLGQGQYGTVRIRGLDPLSVRAVTVRATEEPAAAALPALISDETLPRDLTPEPVGPRELVSAEDVMVYTGDVKPESGQVLSPREVREQLRPAGLLPLQSKKEALAGGAVEIAVELRSGRGSIPALVGGGAGVAVLEVIDAQAFASEISAGNRGASLVESYLAFDGTRNAQFVGMDGALADRWSRLVLRLTLPALDPHTAFDFSLETDPPEARQLLGSHHVGDEAFPIGMLSRSGFEGFSGDESAPVEITPDGPAVDLHAVPVLRSRGRRAAVAVYTPPDSFPYRVGGAGLMERLKITVTPSGGESAWATPSVLLVRPPVVFVHGFTGGPDSTWGPDFVGSFSGRFVVRRADYSSRNASGFDRVWQSIPQEIRSALAALRAGLSVSSDGAEIDQNSTGVGRKVAATRVDAVGFSMGGVALRWYVSDTLASPRDRRIIGSPERLVNFPSISTVRLGPDRFLRTDNFGRGDIRNIVTIGSPLSGSPFANYFLRDVLDNDRLRFAVPVPLVPPVDLAPQLTKSLLWELLSYYALSGRADWDAYGSGFADLAVHSTAMESLRAASAPNVGVHAIAASAVDAPSPFVDILVDLVTGVTQYCPDFTVINSDLVVTIPSALSGVDATGSSPILEGKWHLDLAKVKDTASKVSDGLLYDREDPNPIQSVNRFRGGFRRPGEDACRE